MCLKKGDKMSLDDALKILGLDKKFNEEDLKKAYRIKSKIYHTDLHSNDSENILFYTRMQQDINVAHDILKNYLKQGNKSNNSSNTYWDNMSKEEYENMYYRDMEELNRLKIKYKQEIKKEIDYISKVDSRDKIFVEWKDRFLETIIEFYRCIDSQPNSISLKVNYDVYKNEYFELICWYLYDHWNNSKIIDFAGNLSIDKNDGIKSVRIKMTMTITSILNSEMDEFKSIDNYDEIEPLLLGVRDGFVYVCLFGYSNIDNAKKELKNKIVLEINKYSQRREIIDNLTKYYGYPTSLVIELYNNILNEDKFNSIYNDNVDTKTRVKIKIKKLFSK